MNTSIPLGIVLVLPLTAMAAETENTEDTSSTTGDLATAPQATRTEAPADAPYSPTSKDDRWIDRWAPERNLAELGAFGGVFATGGRHELFEPDASLPDQGYRSYAAVAGEIGARLGYYPSRFFGLEVEGGAMPTETNTFEQATLWNIRGSVVGQLGKWSLTPFVLAGAGGMGVRSDRSAVGNDVDPALHFGGGLKAYLNRRTQVRLDVRDVMGHQRGVENGFSDHNFEALLGVSVVLGRSIKEEEKQSCALPDTDGDGILDAADECVNEPADTANGCPVIDTDGDGWLDPVDACVDEPGVEPAGCPLVDVDTDGDGMLDSVDQCVDQPETDNGFEDTDGCPDELPSELEEFNGVMEGIRFQTNKAVILPRSRPRLDRAAALMVRYPELRVEISGHTDNRGSYEHNVDLSQRRANAVRAYMVAQGVEESRLQTRGAGPSEPISSNQIPDGRSKNRRIQFKVLTGQP